MVRYIHPLPSSTFEGTAISLVEGDETRMKSQLLIQYLGLWYICRL
jgi:hypothetical protein